METQNKKNEKKKTKKENWNENVEHMFNWSYCYS